MAEPKAALTISGGAWPAELDFVLSAQQRRTVLSRLRFRGPLRIQRPFYPENRTEGSLALPCHCYLLHPPGGLVSGDRLQIRGQVERGAHGLITTPAAAKVYRAALKGNPQYQSVKVRVEDDGVLEWLPQETIVFKNADARLETSFSLNRHSRLIGWDILCLGRPAAGEVFSAGRIRQGLRICRRENPLFNELLRLEGENELRLCRPGLQGQTVSATFFACGREGDKEDEQALRRACASLQDISESGGEFRPGLTAATFRAGLLLARYLGAHASGARDFCLTAWRLLRPLLLGRAACEPRIWRT
ncbi:MAG: urease accessory protein UreD [Desulfarculales bacterium]|jgi:urease accessory protein|nr:urease accessory protein UreD [Desulfarculales bacterium]